MRVLSWAHWAFPALSTASSDPRLKRDLPSSSLVSSGAGITAPNGSTSDILRIVLKRQRDPSMEWYTAKVGVNNTFLDLVVDIGESRLWAMSGSFFAECDTVDAEFQDDAGFFTESNHTSNTCALGGVLPEPPNSLFWGGEPVSADTIYPKLNASGVFVLAAMSFALTDRLSVTVNDYLLLLANSTPFYYGALGLAQAVPAQPLGLLQELSRSGLIQADSYSLWFSGKTNSQDDYGQLVPGIVDQQYYTGNLYAYAMFQQYQVDATGKYQPYPSPKLPVVLLSTLRITNILNGKSVALNAHSHIPVLLNSRSEMTYLPFETIIQLATQTSAIYVALLRRWAVPCQIADTNANLRFTFGPLDIDVPIKDFVESHNTSKGVPRFPTGEDACLLRAMPSNMLGVNSLGLTVLRRIYLAVDNDSGQVAMASAAKLDNPKLANLQSAAEHPTTTISYLEPSGQPLSPTLAYIQAGTIPFAITVNASTNTVFSFRENIWPVSFSKFPWLSGDMGQWWSDPFLTATDDTATTTGAARLNAPHNLSEPRASTGFKCLLFVLLTVMGMLFAL